MKNVYLATILTATLCISNPILALCPTMDVTGDCKVNLADFAVFASQWLTEGTQEIVWVSINDTGVGMKDLAGNPISHGGFIGDMSKYETTNAQYAQYLNAALASNDITVRSHYVDGTSGTYSGFPYYDLTGAGLTDDGAEDGGAARINWTGTSFTVDNGFENHPVSYVSWYGATAFASYYGWRLPTQWEWQAVADYDGSYNYGCGLGIDNSIANYTYSIHPDGTTAVAAFGEYGYGMCDMAGNVGEWTSSVSSSDRIIRGGDWTQSGSGCKVALVSQNYPYTLYLSIGFRVCR